MSNLLNENDRVYFTANGPEDTGTVMKVESDPFVLYGVEWDDGDFDLYLPGQITRIES